MEILLLGTFFILGAIVASFAGVVAERLHTGESFLTGRSRCNACNRELSFWSLIPILSYVYEKGRARCCGARILARGSLGELLLGGLFVLSYLSLGLSFVLTLFLVALSLLFALVLYDLAHQILPTALLVPFVGVSALIAYFTSSDLAVGGLTALLIALSLALIHFLSGGRAMGFADAPLAFGLALLTGSSAIAGLVFSFWIGALFGVSLLLGRPKGSRMGVEVPFAPYLAAGFLLAYFTQWNPFLFPAGLL